MTSSGTPYRFEKADGYAVVSLEPELNNAQWSEIEKIGTDLLNQLSSVKSRAMIVDLSSLNYMGSAMVALIVRLWKSVKEDDGRMAVVNRDPNVFEVLKLAGLHKVWTIVDTKEQGIKALGKRAPSPDGGGNTWVMIAGGIVLLIIVAGIAFWFGRMGREGASGTTPPADSAGEDGVEEEAPAVEEDAPAEEGNAALRRGTGILPSGQVATSTAADWPLLAERSPHSVSKWI